MKKIKKKVILVPILLVLIFIILYVIFNLINNYKIKKDFEEDITQIAKQNTKDIFSINKIVYFSNCSAETKLADNSNIIIENLYQYTDIAIYINNDLEETGIYTNENTLKELYITNIQYAEKPSVGTQSLYFKGIDSFTQNEFLSENLIDDTLNFTVTSESSADLTTPVLYNNCANPITISYLNNEIKTDYGINSSSGITYNGSLLDKCYVTLTSLKCTIKFDVYIINNLDEEFVCNVSLDIPLTDGENSLKDGNLKVTQVTDLKFNKIIK
jgi:hypothetical protein